MSGAKRRANIAGGSPSREADVRPRAREEQDEDEAALFRAATRDVRPLAHDRHTVPQMKPPPRARFTRADRLAILDESLEAVQEDPELAGGEVSAYARAGVRHSVLQKLRRGQYRIEAELDLHGLTGAQAKATLREFLAQALHRDLRCVRIVHGKGLRSGPRGPVLKGTVTGILRRSSHVLAFVSARAVDGGTGALYALLSPRG
ncbi:MAG TPA: Smr/MutS family protein [Steroidobacteraceae bacterium]|nr:Smr/MutS family protein [Steroidobacteraceae bacterium]